MALKVFILSLVAFFGTSMAHAGEFGTYQILNTPEIRSEIEKVILAENRSPNTFVLQEEGTLGSSTIYSIELSFFEKKCKMNIEQVYLPATERIVSRIYSPMLCKEVKLKKNDPAAPEVN